MKIIFMGSPDFAVPTLDALVAAGHEVVAVYTQPPRPKGRGKGLQPTAIELFARELGLDVRSPTTLRNEAEQQAFAALNADVAIVAAYGLILPQAILDAPKHGCINIHASLLPRWRGAAPVQRAIMAGDKMTGVTIMQMEAGLDTGPIRSTAELEIENQNAADLTWELSLIGSGELLNVLADLDAHTPVPQPEEGVTYAAKISKEEAWIDWSRPAIDLQRHIQGLAPFPGAWFEVNGERVKVLEAQTAPLARHPRESGDLVEQEKLGSRFRGNDEGGVGTVLDDTLLIQCGADALRPTLVQRAGKGVMTTEELLRGFPIPKGTILS